MSALVKVSRWEQAVDYIAGYREWCRFAGLLAMRVQEASKADGDSEGPWFNWWVGVRVEGSFSERLSVEQGGESSATAAKRECDKAAHAPIRKTKQALGKVTP